MATPSGGVIEKTLIADSKNSLRSHLSSEGNFVLEVNRAEGFYSLFRTNLGRRRIRAKDLLVFNQEFSVLLKAGLPVISALDTIIEKAGDSELVDLLKGIKEDVSAGEALSSAIAKFGHIFSNLYIATIKAGEKSGNIPLAISRHIDYMKKTQAIKQKIITASVYPIILTVVSILVIVFLLSFVLPAFTKTYFEAGTELPALTMALVNLSNTLRSSSFYILAVIVVVMVGFFYFRRAAKGRLKVDEWKLAIPFLGKIYLHYSVVRLARTLATVLSSGTPLLASVRVAGETMTNYSIRTDLEKAGTELEQGAGFSEALSRIERFPPMAIRMINAGEGSGALEQVLNDTAEFYENDVETRLAVLATAIEPALMVVMGLLIGFIVLAMYLPIFQMASAVG
jgi:type IV pilus assembly protein PilC